MQPGYYFRNEKSIAVQITPQVFESRIRQDGHDLFSGSQDTRPLQGCPHIGTTGNAAEQPFLPRKTARNSKGILISNCHDLVGKVVTENGGYEACADAFEAVLAAGIAS